MSGRSINRWTFADPVPAEIRAGLQSGDWQRQEVPILRARGSRVCRFSLPVGDAVLCVRESVPAGFLGLGKTFSRSDAEEEFRCLLAFQAAGLPAPRPIGWAATESGALLVTERICGRDLGVLLDEGEATVEGSEVLAGATDFVAQLMGAGVIHPGLHPSNVLVGGERGAPTFSLFDLRGIRLDAGLGVTEKRRLLVVLVPLLEELSDAERNEALARAVSGDPDASALASWPALVHAWGQLCRDRWRGLRRGLLRDGGHCLEVADSTGRWLIVDSPDGVRDALSSYLDGDSDRMTSLKDDRKRRVARVRTDSASYIVKEYRTARGRWLWRPDRLGWLNTARARSVSLRVAACPAWARGHDGTGYLVQEDVGDACLHDHLAKACPEPADRRPWLTRLADALAFLHLAGCFHADLKTANWIVDAVHGRLRIVDCDDVRSYRQLPEWARERNLRQLSETCPPNVTARERLRFLVAYGRAAGLSRHRRRDLAQGRQASR